jgi:DNA-binding NtrC family response regulator
VDTIRVLFVDDEEDLVSALVERLGYRGVESEYALSAFEALEKLQKATFDVLVLDLKLPGMSGTDLLKIIRAKFPDMPVLMITGHGSPLQKPNERPEGIFDFLAKPISLDALIAKIREAACAN